VNFYQKSIVDFSTSNFPKFTINSWDVSVFVRLFLILTENKFLMEALREIHEKRDIIR